MKKEKNRMKTSKTPKGDIITITSSLGGHEIATKCQNDLQTRWSHRGIYVKSCMVYW